MNAGKPPGIVAAGYTYNKTNDKLTTNYALDGRLGTLVHQGSKEGVQPMVSPNTGRLFAVGSLGLGSFERATLDISDLNNTAYAAITQSGKASWYRIDLETGRAITHRDAGRTGTWWAQRSSPERCRRLVLQDLRRGSPWRGVSGPRAC